jgi:hypothetical protein
MSCRYKRAFFGLEKAGGVFYVSGRIVRTPERQA